jgi:hypothetical protein
MSASSAAIAALETQIAAAPTIAAKFLIFFIEDTLR